MTLKLKKISSVYIGNLTTPPHFVSFGPPLEKENCRPQKKLQKKNPFPYFCFEPAPKKLFGPEKKEEKIGSPHKIFFWTPRFYILSAKEKKKSSHQFFFSS